MPAFKRRDRDNHWYYRCWVKLSDGSRVKVSGKAPLNTKASADRAEREHIERLLNPAPAAPQVVPTVADYADAWIERRKSIAITTAAGDDTRIKLHAVPHIGHLRLNEVKPRHLRDMVLALRSAATLAPRTSENDFNAAHDVQECIRRGAGSW